MSTCFTLACSKRSSESAIAESLLQNMRMGHEVKSCPMSFISAWSHIHSCALLNAAIYSALQDDAATVFCLQTAHDIAPLPRFQAYPPTLHLVSGQLAQSESVYPVRLTSFPFPPSQSHRSLVPFRYRTRRMAAFQWGVA